MKTAAARKLDMAEKLVYNFGDGKAEGSVAMKNQLGGKGANLADMCALGLPVPPGFTVTTDVCVAYFAAQKNFPDALASQVEAGVKEIERIVGRSFGDPKNPLLVSVRSGARASMVCKARCRAGSAWTHRARCACSRRARCQGLSKSSVTPSSTKATCTAMPS